MPPYVSVGARLTQRWVKWPLDCHQNLVTRLHTKEINYDRRRIKKTNITNTIGIKFVIYKFLTRTLTRKTLDNSWVNKSWNKSSENVNGTCMHTDWSSLPIVQNRRPVGWGGLKTGWGLANNLGLPLWLVDSGGLQRGPAAGSPQSGRPSPHSWCLLCWCQVHQTNPFTWLKHKILKCI